MIQSIEVWCILVLFGAIRFSIMQIIEVCAVCNCLVNCGVLGFGEFCVQYECSLLQSCVL